MRNTREALLDEAEQLVRTRGFAGFSYADLAERVGLRKASIHHHFPAKWDLAMALLLAYEARYVAGMAEIETADRDGIARIAAYAALYRDGVDNSLGCLAAAFAAELGTLPESLKNALQTFFAGHATWLARVIAAGQTDGSVNSGCDPAGTARLIMATLEGALMIERVADGVTGFDAVLAPLLTLLQPLPRRH